MDNTLSIRRLIRMLAAALAICAGLNMTVSNADVSFSGVLPGGGLIKKPVVSMAESRYQYVVRQRTDFSCGAASLATILKYAYGMDVDEITVMQGLLQVSDPKIVMKQGFSLLDLKNYAESLGLRARGYRVTLERLRAIRVPTIVMLDISGYKHFVVLKRLVDDQVFIADPALGNKVLPLDDFLDSWATQTVFAVIGSGFDRNTKLLQVKKPPTARHWLAANGPITDSELLDFGFSHADLF